MQSLSLDLLPRSSLLALAAILVPFLAIALFWCYNAILSPLSGIPSASIWASLSLFWTRYHLHRNDKFLLVHEQIQKHGPIIRTGPSSVVVGDYRYLKDVYLTRLDKTEMHNGFRTNRGVPNSFTPAKLAESQGKRRGALPQYATANLLQWQDALDQHTEELVEVAEMLAKRQTNVDIFNLTGNVMVDMLGELIVGERLTNLKDWVNGEDDTIFSVMRNWHRAALLKMYLGRIRYIIWPILVWIPGKDWQAAVQSDGMLADIISPKIIQATMREEERPCLSNRLFHAVDSYTGSRWASDHLISECVAHFIAGGSTTSYTMSFLIWTLAVHPEMQKALQKELDDALPERGQNVDIQQSGRLPYLNGLIKEALRLHSGDQNSLDRLVSEPGMHIAGHFLPAGTEVGVQSYTVHRDPAVWGRDALEFKPERWSDPSEAMLEAFMPFGIGGRSCPGMNFANIGMRLVVCALVRNFDIEPATKPASTEIPFGLPIRDVRVKFTARGV